jgi:thiol:disulfide interchange protein
VKRRSLLGVLLGSLAGGAGCSLYSARTSPVAEQPADWNPEQIAWRQYKMGMRQAARTGTPIVLIFYTDWCPHCHNYSKVFHDSELVRASKDFVMIRVERDSNRELSKRYDIDGEYIPRTFFLSPEGKVLKEFNSGRNEYLYFLDEYDPDELLVLMGRAKKALGG